MSISFEQPKVTVIVPVYNVEEYLPQCLGSIVGQSYRNLEIICVNDGSTDSSGRILDRFVRQDDRIKVLTQENKGLSAARNSGLSHMAGDFVAFIDADDYVSFDYIEKLYFCLVQNQADFSLCQFKSVGVSPKDRPLAFVFNPRVEGQNCPLNPIQLPPMAWGKLFKASIIKQYNLIFPAGLIYEDNYWNFMMCSHATKCAAIREELYFYRENNPSSIMKKVQFDGEKKYDIIKVCCRIREDLEKDKNTYLLNILDQFVQKQIRFLARFHNITQEDEGLKQELNKYYRK